MIFVTLGSQKFQFDRLLKKIDELVENGTITDTVFAQIGASTYLPKYFEYVNFLDREKFAEKMDSCGTVITHGGTGVIIGAVKKGKKVIAVPRLAQYGEHVDNHQVEIAQLMKQKFDVIVVEDMNDLEGAIKKAKNHVYKQWVSHNSELVSAIRDIVDKL